MLRPTYFIGIGDYGNKVVDMIQLISSAISGDPGMRGLFKYHKIYWGANSGYGFNELFKLSGNQKDNRLTVTGGISNRTDAQKAIERAVHIVEVPDRNLWNALDPKGASMANLNQAFRDIVNNDLPISEQREVLIVGDIGDVVSSVVIPEIAKKLHQSGSRILPYGLFRLPDADDDGATAAKAFLYELYTSYSQGASPLFEAVYLNNDPTDNEDVNIYTTARFLMFSQLIIDIPGKLIDIESDGGKGNVILWALCGYRSWRRFAFFKSMMDIIEKYLKKLIEVPHDNKNLQMKSEEILESILFTMINRSSAIRNATTGEIPATSPSANEIEENTKEILWQEMWREEEKGVGEKHKGIGIGKFYLEKILQLARTDYRRNGLWGAWDEVDQNSVKPFKNLGSDGFWGHVMNFLTLGSNPLERDYRDYQLFLAINYFNSHWNGKNDFGNFPPSFGELEATIRNAIDKLEEAKMRIDNTNDTSGAIWMSVSGHIDVHVGDEITNELLKGPYSKFGLIKDWNDLKDTEKLIVIPMEKLYLTLDITKWGAGSAVPEMSRLVTGIEGKFIKLRQGVTPRVLYKGWIGEIPPGNKGDLIPLDNNILNLKRNAFWGDHDYIVIRTNVGLEDIQLQQLKPSNVILVDKYAERLRFKKFLELFTIASLNMEWVGNQFLVVGLREPYKGVWDIGKISITLSDDKGNIIIDLPFSHSWREYPRSIEKRIEKMSDNELDALRGVLTGKILPEIYGDKHLRDHLSNLFMDPQYKMGLSEIALFVQAEIFQLPYAPADAESIVNNSLKILYF